MKTQAKHTAIPWRICSSQSLEWQDCIYDSKGTLIAQTASNGSISDCIDLNNKEALANAAFIVKAVNSHEALCNDLRQAVFYLEELTNTKPHFIKHAKETLKQAEGE